MLTFGAGGHPFSRFGHDALRIADRRTGSDIVYNFGTFSSDSPNLVVDFLRGRLSYWLSRSHIATTLLSYRRTATTTSATIARRVFATRSTPSPTGACAP